jgi:SAM-dependent methyltransferase
VVAEVLEVLPLVHESVASLLEPMTAMLLQRREAAGRSRERLRAHYRVERRIADRLRAARDAAERRAIFATMYEELFREVPDHPRLLKGGDAARERERDVAWDLAQLSPYLAPGCTFLEVGAGDCALSRRVAEVAKAVYAVDISDQARAPLPANVQLVISDGSSIPVPEASVDVAFSDQLMEHLHPDDAREQLANIHRALKPGGVYFFITPNRLYGPSDISAYFDDVASGFHLREYSLGELAAILSETGFPTVQPWVGARGVFMRCPFAPLAALEQALDRMPARWRRGISQTKPLRALLGVRLAARKGTA